MTYQPFLPEAAAGAIEPRHLTVPLRRVLRRCDVITGPSPRRRRVAPAVVTLPDGGTRELTYDVLVVAPGTTPRAPADPGARRARAAVPLGHRRARAARARPVPARRGRLDGRPAERRRLLTFTVIGGGFAGLEVLGELEDMTRRAARHQPGLRRRGDALGGPRGGRPDHARGQPGPGRARARPAAAPRASRSASGAKLISAEGGTVVLARRHALRHRHDRRGRGLGAQPAARAHRPAARPARPRTCSTTLQVRDRAARVHRGRLRRGPRRHRGSRTATRSPRRHPPPSTPSARPACSPATSTRSSAGGCSRATATNAWAVAGLGRRRGAAQIGRLRFTGWPAFLLHRAYHLWAMPTADRTVRIGLDWLVSGLLGRDLVALGRRDAAPVPEAPAPPTVAPRVDESEIGVQTPSTGGTPTWGAEPPAPATGPLPGRVCPPRQRHRLAGPPGVADRRGAVGLVPGARPGAGRLRRDDDPRAAPLAAVPRAGAVALLRGVQRARAQFSEPTPSGSFPEDGPRAPYPSTSRPRHSLRD